MGGTTTGPADPAELAQLLLDEIVGIIDDANQQGRTVRLYHYGKIDPIYLERLLGESAERLLAIATDLLAVIRQHYFAGIGYGLKRLAGMAGFAWHDDGMTGADTYSLVERARAGSPEAWASLLRYNEGDTRATKLLRDWVRAQ